MAALTATGWPRGSTLVRDTVERLFTEQGGRCAECGVPFPPEPTPLVLWFGMVSVLCCACANCTGCEGCRPTVLSFAMGADLL